MTNIIEIAKANGAERIEAHDEFTQSGVFFQDDQLTATVQQVCAPLVEALQSAINCGMGPSSSAKDGGASKHSLQVKVADQIREALAAHKATMGVE